MANRDANLVIVALSPHAHTVHAGVGVAAEVIAAPAHTLDTQISLPASLVGEKRKWSDYRVEQGGSGTSNALNGTANGDGAADVMVLDAVPPTTEWSRRSVFRDEGTEGPGDPIPDWKALDAYFRHLLYDVLKASKPPISNSLLLSVPPHLSPSTRDRLTQLCFEALALPAVYFAETPLLQLMACNATTGISIDVGLHSTEIGVVFDSVVQHSACSTVPIGEADCDDYLLALLLSTDPTLPSQLSPDPSVPLTGDALETALRNALAALKAEDFIRFEPAIPSLKSSGAGGDKDANLGGAGEDDDGNFDVAQAIVSGKLDQMKAAAAGNKKSAAKKSSGPTGTIEVQQDTDTILLPHPTAPTALPAIAIGPVRHRHAEPLFDPSLLALIPKAFEAAGLPQGKARRYAQGGKSSLLEAILRSVRKIEPSAVRSEVLESIVFTGQISRTEGLAAGIVSNLTSQYLLPSDVGYGPNGQSLYPRHAKVPDYFSEFKGHPEWAAFLGGSIVAKIVFADMSSSKLWMSKPDYNKGGPFISRRLEDGASA